MPTADWLGSAGVGLLLLAFALNLFGRLARRSRLYQGMNAMGAGLACAALVAGPCPPPPRPPKLLPI